jgi:transcriptional regulator with XRE-family HTH domain
MNQSEVLNIIEKERVRQKISLREIGRLSGLSHATYQSARRLERGMTWDSIIRILSALGFKLKVETK